MSELSHPSDGGEASANDRVPRRRNRLRQAAARRRATDALWRVLVGVIGGLITLIGVVALIGPGPGWLILFVGLGVLASEFAWADRALIRAKVAAFRARDRAMAPEARKTLYAASTFLVVILGGGLFLWVR